MSPPSSEQTVTFDFDQESVGKDPAGWMATQTGTGGALWSVVQDGTAPSPPNVLKQSGTATYPICLREDSHNTDGFVEVTFKPVSGLKDQAASSGARRTRTITTSP